MAETITVASRLPMSIRIQEPNPSPEKPGEAPLLRSVIINGASHPASVGETGITEGVDAEMFRAWQKANANHEMAGMLTEVEKPEEAKAVENGFEPELERVKADADNSAKAAEGSTDTKLGKAAEGSTDTKLGPVMASDMAASSTVPNDDSPRSQVNGVV